MGVDDLEVSSGIVGTVCYRDPTNSSCGAGFDLTNGVAVRFTP